MALLPVRFCYTSDSQIELGFPSQLLKIGQRSDVERATSDSGRPDGHLTRSDTPNITLTVLRLITEVETRTEFLTVLKLITEIKDKAEPFYRSFYHILLKVEKRLRILKNCLRERGRRGGGAIPLSLPLGAVQRCLHLPVTPPWVHPACTQPTLSHATAECTVGQRSVTPSWALFF